MVDATSKTESQTNGNPTDKCTKDATVKMTPKSEPNPLVICGPSGSGKSTILKAIMAKSKFKDLLAFSVSHTTRAPRAGEVDGREYYFTNRESMLAEIKAGKFIESAEYSGNLYGTSKESVHKCKSSGKICVLDIDSQGVRSLKKVSNLSPVYVFVKPPSLQALEERLRSRKTETEESLTKRLDAAKEEIAFGEEEGAFDALLVNDDLDAAIDQLINIIDSKILAADSSIEGQERGSGDAAANEDGTEDVGGKRAKLEAPVDSAYASGAESSRDSTPSV